MYRFDATSSFQFLFAAQLRRYSFQPFIPSFSPTIAVSSRSEGVSMLYEVESVKCGPYNFENSNFGNDQFDAP